MDEDRRRLALIFRDDPHLAQMLEAYDQVRLEPEERSMNIDDVIDRIERVIEGPFRGLGRLSTEKRGVIGEVLVEFWHEPTLQIERPPRADAEKMRDALNRIGFQGAGFPRRSPAEVVATTNREEVSVGEEMDQIADALRSPGETREQWRERRQVNEPVPFTPGKSHVPDYYRLRVPTLEPVMVRRDDVRVDGNCVKIMEQVTVEIDMMEIVRIVSQDRHPFVGFALKYLLRAGRKSGEPAMKDLYKAMECLQRLLPKEEPA